VAFFRLKTFSVVEHVKARVPG